MLIPNARLDVKACQGPVSFLKGQVKEKFSCSERASSLIETVA